MEFVFLVVWLIFTMFAIYGLIKRTDKLNKRVERLENSINVLYDYIEYLARH